MNATGSDRMERLAGELREAGVDAFLAWSPTTMGYLQGFSEGAGERFLTLALRADGTVRLICPALSATQAARSGIADIRPWKDGEDPVAHFKQLADDWNLRSAIIAVDDEMPAHLLLTIQAALPAALFKPGAGLVANLMRVKTPEELALLHQAGAIADRAFPAGVAAVRPGATEAQVADALFAEMRRLGGTPTFAIVATGANGAEPHHLSDATPIQEGDVVVMDFGCEVGGYQSDITRTVACGKAPEEAKKVYATVLAAHHAARKAIAAGVACGTVDAAARKVIEDAGYGEFFVHRTGHGLGTRVHEEPNIIGGSEQRLEPGHCFSIEPGIYLPGRFGVRIENIVTCTEAGHTSFNEDPAEELREV
ncbi:MAG: Xaa-Pro peptidase family protein [Fimbriimonadaceae bacterium]|nr:Xaa-Pro peptidase family protein [Fimbriimonadaceae bacterium]